LNNNDFLHLNYIGKNIFLHKIFSHEIIEMMYGRVSVARLNNDGDAIIDNDGDVVIDNVGAVIRDDHDNSHNGHGEEVN